MDDQEWKAAFDLMQQAESLPVIEREAFVRSHTSHNPALLELVSSVLDSHESDPAHGPGPGTRFGRYEIRHQIGRGGTGTVYLALDLEVGRQVALKLLTPEVIAQHRSRKRLIKEAQAASALHHPNIVAIYEVVHSGDDLGIAMEFIAGDSLRKQCGKVQSSALVIPWARQISSALSLAHQNGVMHCDIKPENLMLQPDGTIKVVDFGLARRLVPSASTESISLAAGTFEYFSPEQAAGHRPVAASDVFSLGVVLYELMAGKRPFAGETSFDTLHAVTNDLPKRPSTYNLDISPNLDQLILRMLEKNPAARPSADAVAAALNETPRPAGLLARTARRLIR